jgi:hypothetical protein
MDEQFSEPEPNLIEGTEGFCIRFLAKPACAISRESGPLDRFRGAGNAGRDRNGEGLDPILGRAWRLLLVDETARNRIAGNIKRAEAMTPAQLSLWASCYPSGARSQMWKGFGSRRQAVVEPRSSSFGPFPI